jgi:hypothetical protein
MDEDFPLEFVKYGQYSPHSSEKSDSTPRPLATATILGQAPRLLASFSTIPGLRNR